MSVALARPAKAVRSSVPRSAERARARWATAQRLTREHRPHPGRGDARVRQPRAGHRALRAARRLPAGARRHHGPGLSGLHHRHARGRRGVALAVPGRAHRHLRRHAARARHRALARRRASRRAPGSTSSTASRRRSSWRAGRRGAGVLRHRLRDHRRGHRGGAARRAAAELLGALGAQVHPAGDGDRRGDARRPASRVSSPPATRPPSPAGACSSRSSSATASRSWSRASSRSTSSPGWCSCSS